MRQLVLKTDPPAQGGAGPKNIQHTPIRRLEVSAQDQTGHQLALREIVAAGSGTVIRQIVPAQSHAQFGHLLDHRHLATDLFALVHASVMHELEKGFYRAYWTLNAQETSATSVIRTLGR